MSGAAPDPRDPRDARHPREGGAEPGCDPAPADGPASTSGSLPRSAEELLPLVYQELRALARSQLAREASARTLQPTMLVHEAYLRLVGEADPGWNGKGHFFGAAARAMRRILVEAARRRSRLRHGGDRERVPLDDPTLAIEPPAGDLLAVDGALQKLERADPRKGRIVELRYFAGLSIAETAALLGVSRGTVEREWRFTKAWLLEELAR